MRSAVDGGINEEMIDKILKGKVQVKHVQVQDSAFPVEQARVLVSLWTYLDSAAAPWLAEVR
jgi:hypothetical protein